MPFAIADLLAPHYCCSCGKIGQIICDYCKYDITESRYEQCIVCLGLTIGEDMICSRCRPPYRRAWVSGERSGSLERLIDLYKFSRARAGYGSLLDILDSTISTLPSDVVIVGVPTIARHIRERGTDHVARLCKGLAKRRGLPYRPVLERRTSTVQHSASRANRKKQASEAFTCQALDGEIYLLIDDIYTTGSTIEFASRALQEAGAREVWVAVLSRQPLEKHASI